MRPCSNCRSEDTEPLDQGLITRLVSTLGGEPTLRAWVCRLCRHVDFWVDEPIESGEYRTVEADDVATASEGPGPIPIPAT